MSYKEDIMLIADQAAEEQYGMDFYSLMPGHQQQIYEKAMQSYYDQQADRAENMRDAVRDDGTGL